MCLTHNTLKDITLFKCPNSTSESNTWPHQESNRRECMRRCTNVNEARGVCLDRVVWWSVPCLPLRRYGIMINQLVCLNARVNKIRDINRFCDNSSELLTCF